MDECDLPTLVAEVKAWTKKLSSSCVDVVNSLEKVGSSDDGNAEALRRGCGAVATSMTQLVAFCHKAQRAAAPVLDASSYVTTMNGFVVASITLTKGLIKIAKAAMGTKNRALDTESLSQARSLLAELQENCAKISKCTEEVVARSPRERRGKGGESISAHTSPVTSPRSEMHDSFETDRLVVQAIKMVMALKEILTRAIHTRDAVEFVSKAKELVTAFSALQKATLRHSQVSLQFGVEKMSSIISSFVRAAKGHFQAPTDAKLHLAYDKSSSELNTMLKEMVALVKTSRASLGALGTGSAVPKLGSAASLTERDIAPLGRRATVGGGVICMTNDQITMRTITAFGAVATESQSLLEGTTRTNGTLAEAPATTNEAVPEVNGPMPHEELSAPDAELLADIMAKQLEEEEREEAAAMARKIKLEEQQMAVENKSSKEKQKQKKGMEEQTLSEVQAPEREKEEKKRKAEESEDLSKTAEEEAEREAEEAAAEAAAIAAIEAGFEEAEKHVIEPNALLVSEPSREDSAEATEALLQSMQKSPVDGEWLATTVRKEEKGSCLGSSIRIGTEPVRQRGVSVANQTESVVLHGIDRDIGGAGRKSRVAGSDDGARSTGAADNSSGIGGIEGGRGGSDEEAGKGKKGPLSSSAELAEATRTETAKEELKLPAKMPVMKKNVLGKSKTGADIVLERLTDLYPQFKEIFHHSARAGLVKDLINDDLVLVDTLRRNVTVTGRGGSECHKLSKAMTTVMVAIHCYVNGLASSARGSDERRASAVEESRGALLRALLMVVDSLGDHAKDTVPKELHSQSLDHLTNTVVNAVEKGAPPADQHVLSACRVHTVGLIESQLRENLFNQTKALHGMTVQLLHVMKIVFSGAMVEFNAWVELCAVCAAVVRQLEAVLGCTQTLVEVVRKKDTNFSHMSSTEEIDVEDLVNIFIWNEGDSLPAKGGKIKTGTLNQLVSYLTSDEKIDNAFLRTFVCTYRSFSTPVQLLEKLKERFEVPPNIPMTRTEAIQLRVCVTLKYWVQNQFPDFDEALIISLFTFLNQVEDAGHSAMAEGIRQQLKEKMEERALQMHSRGNLLPSPLVLSSKPSLVSDYLEQHSALDVAKQLTLIDFSIFSLIRPAELMNQAWTSKKLSHRAIHVCTFMNRVNTLSNWVATLILSRPNLMSRIKTMQFFVEVAWQLRSMNNYHSLMGIVAGTNVSAVSRLKHTKDGLSKDLTKKMASLEQLMHPSGSFKHYRKQLAASKYPIIPYLGVYLTDLVFIEDGNPDEVDGFINFEKRELAFAPVQAVQTAQGEGFSFPKCEPLFSTLQHICQLDDELLWTLSQTAEPRNAQLKDVK